MEMSPGARLPSHNKWASDPTGPMREGSGNRGVESKRAAPGDEVIGAGSEALNL